MTVRSPASDTKEVARETVGAVVALTTLLAVVLIAFAWPTSQIEPRNLPVAVAAPDQLAQQLEANLGQALGEDALDVTGVATREAAVDAIEGREVYGAVVVSPVGVEVLTASAASPAAAQLLGQIGGRLGAATGTQPTITDVVPLPEDDPRGMVFGVGSFPLVIGGIITAALLTLRLGTRTRRLVAAAGVAAFAGLALAGVLQFWFGALEGSYLANAGVVAMSIGAMAFTMIGLHNLFGLPGLGLGAATMLLLGNPLSGTTSAPELLPNGWSTLGQLLPPGAAGTALRSTGFFDGAGAMTPLLVLTGWLVLGLVLASIPRRRGEEPAADRRTDSLASAVDPSAVA